MENKEVKKLPVSNELKKYFPVPKPIKDGVKTEKK